MNACGMVAVVCAGVMAGGCAHECEAAYHAATAADVACAAAGVATRDPALLLQCHANTVAAHDALRTSKCAPHLGTVKP